MSASSLDRMLQSIFAGGSHYLEGMHTASPMPELLTAVVAWVGRFNRSLQEVVAAIEPCVRQSVLMSLLPAKAFDPGYSGSFDLAIREHLAQIGIAPTADIVAAIRTLCININRLRGLSSADARRMSATIGDLRADPPTHNLILTRQNSRCFWCGVALTAAGIRESLDHIVPKHMGDDPPDGSNWAITCTACNRGKDNVFMWSTSAAAFDYVERSEFGQPGTIGLKQRWCTLARQRKCEFCKQTTRQTELWAFRRVRTGLAIPANCGATCGPCGRTNSVDLPVPRWPAEESTRPTS